jgi:hypothetical protein
MPSSAAAPRPWALIVISARAADIRLSLTTHAVTGTAPDVRATLHFLLTQYCGHPPLTLGETECNREDTAV